MKSQVAVNVLLAGFIQTHGFFPGHLVVRPFALKSEKDAIHQLVLLAKTTLADSQVEPADWLTYKRKSFLVLYSFSSSFTLLFTNILRLSVCFRLLNLS